MVALVRGEGGDGRGNGQHRAVYHDVLGEIEGEEAMHAGQGGDVAEVPPFPLGAALDLAQVLADAGVLEAGAGAGPADRGPLDGAVGTGLRLRGGDVAAGLGNDGDAALQGAVT